MSGHDHQPDEHGVVHRHGCGRPGWTSEGSTPVVGVVVNRCSECGACRLATIGGRS